MVIVIVIVIVIVTVAVIVIVAGPPRGPPRGQGECADSRGLPRQSSERGAPRSPQPGFPDLGSSFDSKLSVLRLRPCRVYGRFVSNVVSAIKQHDHLDMFCKSDFIIFHLCCHLLVREFLAHGANRSTLR